MGELNRKLMLIMVLTTAMITVCLNVKNTNADDLNQYIRLNGSNLPFADKIIFESGAAMAPLKQAAESVLADVHWYPEDNHIIITDGNNTLNVMAGEANAYLNDSSISMPSAIELINDRSYISIRTIYESFGYQVNWDENTQSIYIISNEKVAKKTIATFSQTGNSIFEDLSVKSLTIAAIGDCLLGNDPRFRYSGSFNEAYDNYGPSYFFDGVKEVLAGNDLSIANLETNLTDASQEVDKSFQGTEAFFFKGYPAYVNILQNAHINAVSIANNHSLDFEKQGMQDTIQNLLGAGIGCFGYERKYITTIKGIKIGLLGCNDMGPLEKGTDPSVEKWYLSNDIKSLHKQGCKIVIVYFHWGLENSYWPTDWQQNLGRFAIDSGADLVLGAHPHVIEPVEKYKGKYIAYSLGNFCFGGNNNPEDKDTYIFQETFIISSDVIIGSQISIVPCSISSSTSVNDYRPRVLTGDDANRVINKVLFIGNN